MNNKINMAIIGFGFVGKAVDYGFNNPNCVKYIIDPLHNTSVEDLRDKQIDVTFVCVPTPMGIDGKIDSSIIEDCVNYLLFNVSGLVVIKSTVTPDIITMFGEDIIYNPEFLTEKAANEDFVNPILHVFGGKYENTKKLEYIYEEYSSCKQCPVFHMSLEDASLVKYGINSFLATKVLWFNQFYDIVEKVGGNYGKIVSAIGTDKRVGTSHTTVPGFDGKRGFSGSCFPKDTFAFMKYAEKNNADFTVLKEVIRQNQNYRLNYDLSPREIQQNIRFDLNV